MSKNMELARKIAGCDMCKYKDKISKDTNESYCNDCREINLLLEMAEIKDKEQLKLFRILQAVMVDEKKIKIGNEGALVLNFRIE